MIKALNILALVLSIVIAQCSFAQISFHYASDFKKVLTKTKDPADALSYDKLLKRFNANDSTLSDYEVLALLIGFTDKPEYKPYDDLDIEREIYKLNGEKKYAEALELANKFLKTHPLSVKALFEKSYAYHKLDQDKDATYFATQGFMIFKAMYFSGDGQSQETASFALGPADGQDYIYKFVRADIGTMGSGRDGNNNFLDILDAKFKDGHVVQLYFIIQHATNKMFGGKSLKQIEEQKKK